MRQKKLKKTLPQLLNNERSRSINDTYRNGNYNSNNNLVNFLSSLLRTRPSSIVPNLLYTITFLKLNKFPGSVSFSLLRSYHSTIFIHHRLDFPTLQFIPTPKPAIPSAVFSHIITSYRYAYKRFLLTYNPVPIYSCNTPQILLDAVVLYLDGTESKFQGIGKQKCLQ